MSSKDSEVYEASDAVEEPWDPNSHRPLTGEGHLVLCLLDFLKHIETNNTHKNVNCKPIWIKQCNAISGEQKTIFKVTKLINEVSHNLH